MDDDLIRGGKVLCAGNETGGQAMAIPGQGNCIYGGKAGKMTNGRVIREKIDPLIVVEVTVPIEIDIGLGRVGLFKEVEIPIGGNRCEKQTII